MGAIQGSINRIVGSISAGILATTAMKRLGGSEPAGKTMAGTEAAKEPNIDLAMRDKALKKAQYKIDAINKQNLGRNSRMKAIRGVIDDFSKQDFSTKGGSK